MGIFIHSKIEKMLRLVVSLLLVLAILVNSAPMNSLDVEANISKKRTACAGNYHSVQHFPVEERRRALRGIVDCVLAKTGIEVKSESKITKCNAVGLSAIEIIYP
jgi:hypothetical protein